MKMTITNADIIGFQSHLLDMERSPATIQKYLRDVTAFALWLGDRPITKENTMAWKAQLAAVGRAPAGVNATLSALNGFLRFAGFDDCRVRFLKVQRRIYRDETRELTEKEYHRLIAAAERLGRKRLRWCSKPSAPRASASASCASSPWRPSTTARRRSA